MCVTITLADKMVKNTIKSWTSYYHYSLSHYLYESVHMCIYLQLLHAQLYD